MGTDFSRRVLQASDLPVSTEMDSNTYVNNQAAQADNMASYVSGYKYVLRQGNNTFHSGDG